MIMELAMVSDDDECSDVKRPTVHGSSAQYEEGKSIGRNKGDKRRKKAKDKPRRPLSAYNLFFKEERDKILNDIADHNETSNTNDERGSAVGTQSVTVSGSCKRARVGDPINGLLLDMANTQRPPRFDEMSKIIGARWKKIDPERLARYKKMADAEMERYKVAMKEYNDKIAEKQCHGTSFVSPSSTVGAKSVNVAGRRVVNKNPPPAPSLPNNISGSSSFTGKQVQCPELLVHVGKSLNSNPYAPRPLAAVKETLTVDLVKVNEGIHGVQTTRSMMNAKRGADAMSATGAPLGVGCPHPKLSANGVKSGTIESSISSLAYPLAVTRDMLRASCERTKSLPVTAIENSSLSNSLLDSSTEMQNFFAPMAPFYAAALAEENRRLAEVNGRIAVALAEENRRLKKENEQIVKAWAQGEQRQLPLNSPVRSPAPAASPALAPNTELSLLRGNADRVAGQSQLAPLRQLPSLRMSTADPMSSAQAQIPATMEMFSLLGRKG